MSDYLGNALDALYRGIGLLPRRDDTHDTRQAIAEAIVAVLEARGAKERDE